MQLLHGIKSIVCIHWFRKFSKGYCYMEKGKLQNVCSRFCKKIENKHIYVIIYV